MFYSRVMSCAGFLLSDHSNTKVGETHKHMPITKLALVNRTLHLCGEQSLANTTGTLGSIAKGCLQSALVQVIQQSRSRIFEKVQTFTLASSDWTVPETNVDPNTVQILRVRWYDGTNWNVLEQQEYDSLPWVFGYSIIANAIYVSPMFARPLNIDMLTQVVPLLDSYGDGDTMPFADIVIPSLIHVAASILLLSYIDDANAAAAHEKIASTFVSSLRSQTGITYGRTLSMRGTNT